MAPLLLHQLILIIASFSLISLASAGDFNRDFDLTWGDGRAKILDNGQLLTLSLDKSSGSGFQSKNSYLFGKIDMQLKLVPGNSAGTVTAYYLSSQGPTHDEIDFEFLGNVTSEPYTLHTNIFTQGKGNREQQFKLWFDPTKDFHTYSVLWNPSHVIFSVDGIPIRDFKNLESRGVGFPKNQPMRIYSSLWAAEDWATQGGRVKTDWTKAPFSASYRNFNADACVIGTSTCSWTSSWFDQQLDSTSYKRLRWVQRNYMIYNYCADRNRFPQGLPTECVRIIGSLTEASTSSKECSSMLARARLNSGSNRSSNELVHIGGYGVHAYPMRCTSNNNWETAVAEKGDQILSISARLGRPNGLNSAPLSQIWGLNSAHLASFMQCRVELLVAIGSPIGG